MDIINNNNKRSNCFLNASSHPHKDIIIPKSQLDTPNRSP